VIHERKASSSPMSVMRTLTDRPLVDMTVHDPRIAHTERSATSDREPRCCGREKSATSTRTSTPEYMKNMSEKMYASSVATLEASTRRRTALQCRRHLAPGAAPSRRMRWARAPELLLFVRREVDKSNTPDDDQSRAWGSVWGKSEPGSRCTTECKQPGDSAPRGSGGPFRVGCVEETEEVAPAESFTQKDRRAHSVCNDRCRTHRSYQRRRRKTVCCKVSDLKGDGSWRTS
jgi:hypothetical protein